MKHLSPETIEKIKQILVSEKARLERELKGFTTKDNVIVGNYTSKYPEIGNDEDENANEVADYSDRLSLEHTLEKELRDVDAALERMANGTYGLDKYTGEEIPEARLLARPTAGTTVENKKRLQGEE